MNQFIAWLVLGLLAGLLARWIMPGSKGSGWLGTILLGIGGAFVGGWLAQLLGFIPAAQPGTLLPSLGSILSATLGAIVILAVVRLIKR